uniref:Uncharacterized protein n=1 Tax=Solanum lycopersicum TaxID=4081 RepID=A0A3Q7EMD1_SOLLC
MALCFPIEVFVGSAWGKVNLPWLMPRPAEDLDQIGQKVAIGMVQLYVYCRHALLLVKTNISNRFEEAANAFYEGVQEAVEAGREFRGTGQA